MSITTIPVTHHCDSELTVSSVAVPCTQSLVHSTPGQQIKCRVIPSKSERVSRRDERPLAGRALLIYSSRAVEAALTLPSEYLGL